MIAANDGNVELINFLITNDADIELIDSDGWNALDISILRI